MSRKNIENIYPLSPMQQGMLFHTLSAQESGVYLVQLACTLRGAFDVAAFERAWQDVVDRHPILRTAFVWEKVEKPLQVVRAKVRLPVEHEDLRGLTPEAQRARIDAKMAAASERGFDVAKAPLMRLSLMRLADDTYRFLWTRHHLLLDGWSTPLVLREVFELYEAHATGKALALPAPRPFADYVAWLGKQDAKRAEAHFREELRGFTTPTPLGIGRAVPASLEGWAEEGLDLPEATLARIAAFARQHQLTMSTVVQGAWALLLQRYSGEADVVFGATVSGRAAPVPGIEKMVGLFINTLPVRARASEGDTVAAWLTALQARQAEQRELEYSPLAQVQTWSEAPRGRALFDSIVVFENFPVEQLAQKGSFGVELADVSVTEATSYPLTLVAAVHRVLSLRLQYDRRLFDREPVARALGHLATLLEAMADRPTARLDSLSILTDRERTRLVFGFNDTAEDYPHQTCVHELVTAQAQRRPDATAVLFGDAQLTYAELEARSNRLARRLVALGVGPEVLVGLCVERSIEMVVAMLGILKAGGSYVPLDPDYPKARIAFILEDAQAPVLVTQASLTGGLPTTGAHVLAIDTDAAAIAAESDAPLGRRATPDDRAYAIYTSGSTGKPKGVEIQHRALTNFLTTMARLPGMHEQDTLVAVTSLSFDIAGLELFLPLVTGARVDVAPREVSADGVLLAARLEQVHATMLQATPATYRVLLAAGWAGKRDLVLLCGGEALPASLADALEDKGAALWNMFGPTETTIWSAVHRVTRTVGVVPIGRPIGNTQLFLFDRRMQLVPAGVAGELYIGGDGLARGYLGRPELTAERFVASPIPERAGERLYRTGDLARYLPDGTIEFLGRIDHQVKIRGFRVELGEIEDALGRHPAVREAVVVARDSESGEQRLVAYVVFAGEPLSFGDVRAHLGESLPDYMLPSAVVALLGLPLTPNGKVDRLALPDAAAAPAPEVAYQAPVGRVEQVLVDAFEAVLRTPGVGVHDNFFQLGGDSILSIQIVSRARAHGVVVRPAQLFEHPTVAALAAAVAPLDERPAADDAPGAAPLTPIQRWFFAQGPAAPSHDNQAILLEVGEPLDASRLQPAVAAVVAHHDALRLAFTPTAGGSFEQQAMPVGGPAPFSRVDLSGAPDRREALEQAVAEVQSSLDLARGLVFRVVLFDLGSEMPQRLLVVANHLVIDGVSWRIVMDDLWSAYHGARLPPKTASFRRWATRIDALRRADATLAEAPYWLALADAGARPLPVDHPGADTSEATARSVTTSLGEEQTRALLHDVPPAYLTRIQDVLLTALARALGRWAGAPLLVDVEGHGRDEALFDDVDLSRTVGWFTAIHPLALRLEPAAGPAHALLAMKEQLRAVPRLGVGFGLLRDGDGEIAARVRALPRAEVSFTYLGQLDQALPAGAPFSPARESHGLLRSPASRRRHALEISAAVLSGKLTVRWTYSEGLHDRATIEGLARSYDVALSALVAHCLAPDAGGRSPSDYPDAGLSQADLERLVGKGRDVDDLHPLTPTQEGMLFHALEARGSGVYFEQVACTLDGLDVAAFRAAWQDVAARHAVLRTAYVWDGLPRPLAWVHKAVTIAIDEIDLRGLETREQTARVDATLAEQKALGFDLGRPPAMRLTLFRLADASHRLLWCFHHILLDGWAIQVLLKDVFVHYGARVRGRASSEALRPGVPRPFGDYAKWVARQDPARVDAFFREELKGFTAPTPLTALRRLGELSPGEAAFAEAHVALPEALSAALVELGKRHELTLNTVVQGALAIVLGRYAREEDVVFGATVSGRSAPVAGIESMVGVMINTVPVRARMAPDQPLVAWLRSLQAKQIETRELEHASLARVQAVSDVPRGRPLFEGLFVFENYPLDASLQSADASLQVRDARFDERTNYPLTVTAWVAGTLQLKLAWDRRRFSDAAAGRMLGHLGALLGAMAAAPSSLLGDLAFVTEAERRTLVEAWNATDRAYPPGETLHGLFEAQVDRTPDAVAVSFEHQWLTYRELDARANQLAHRLRALGVGPDVLVGVAMERSIELVVALYAVLKAGGAYLPLDPEYPADRLAFMLEDAAVPVLLVQEAVGRGLPAHAATVLALDTGWAAIEGEPTARLAGLARPEHLAYAIYTSGSTGQPKGALNTHAGIVNRLRWMQDAYGLVADDVVLQKTPYSFDVSVWELFWPLLVGAKLVLARPGGHRDPTYLARTIAAERVTTLHFVPSMLQAFLEEPDAVVEGLLASVRRVFCSGEALPLALQERFFARMTAELHNLYGPTEAAVDVTYWACDRASRLPFVPIGRPVANTQIYLLDDAMRPVPVGVAGELYIGGVQVARGYLNRAALTAERFVRSPFGGEGARLYRTGDLARYLDDGTIEYLGRTDHQVKLRGFRIELGEIESVLALQPAVREAVVLAREDEPGDMRLVAYLVARDEAAGVDTAAIKLALAGKLPDYMIPSAFVTLAAMPLTSSGKVDRKLLPAPEGRVAQASSFEPPRGPVEEAVASIFGDVLHTPRVGRDDTFFELGGHSLLATQVVSRVRSALGVDLELRVIFEAPRVADLAGRVEAAMREGEGVKLPPIERASRDHSLALSFGQERLWFLEQLDPDSTAYNMPAALRLRGPLDPLAMEHALRVVAMRHEVLRTSLMSEDGRPVQVIHDELAIPLSAEDLSSVPEAAREQAMNDAIRREATRPFRLARAPLLRAKLLRLADDDHVLVVTVHHIVADAWTVGVLVREVAALYDASLRTATPAEALRAAGLEPLPIQYGDYAEWQRGWLQGEALERELGYWTKQLEGAPTSLDLPTDRPRPAVQSYRGAKLPFSLDAALSRELVDLCRREGVTLYMLALTAFNVLLHRYSGQTDILVGTSVADRRRPETEGLIGYFLNQLVLRTDMSGEPTFRALLRRVREACLGAYAHQDLPFERLVEAMRLKPDMGRTPLFQVMVDVPNAPTAKLELPGLTLEGLAFESGSSRFDLTLSVSETPNGIQGTLEYASDLFDASTIERMLVHFEALVRGAAASPDARLFELPMLTEAERHMLLVAWNDTAADFPRDACVHALFEAQVDRTPDAVAVEASGERITYAALNERANRLAHHLIGLGVGPDVLVGLSLPRTIDLVTGILAIVKAGGAYVPLDPTYPIERLAWMLEDSSVPVVVTNERLEGGLPAQSAMLVRLDADADAVAAQPATNPVSGATAMSLAYVIYTSGSTGKPKGAMIHHRGLVNYLTWAAQAYDVAAGDGAPVHSSVSFDLTVTGLYAPLLAGKTVFLVPEEDEIGALATALRDHHGYSLVKLTPAHLEVLSHSLDPLDVKGSAGAFVIGGEALSWESLAFWRQHAPGTKLINEYGPTETVVGCCVYDAAQGEAGTGVVPIGRPIANTQLYVLGAHLELAPIGAPGELYIGGEGVGRGYLNRPDLSDERFLRDPFRSDPEARLYKTGDLARYLPSGDLEFLGRLDHQVKIRGYRIELGEIEAALRQHPSLGEVIVIAREDAPGDRRLVAYVVPAGGPAPGASELRAFVAERLPEYMIPAAFVALDALPLTSNAKVDRRALPAPDARATETASYVAPRGPVEEALCRIWSEVLHVAQVGVNDNFFELGGHSLVATQVVARIRTTLQVSLDIRALFESPTVAGLGRIVGPRVGAGDAVMAPPMTRTTREGDLPLSFAQERLWFLDQLEPGHTAYNIPAGVRLEGKLDVGAMERAIAAIVARHEVLRTRFGAVRGRPIQLIGEGPAAALATDDLAALTPAERERAVDERLAAEVLAPFDLAKGPLVRTRLFRLAAEEHVLLFTMHHIVSDAWTMGVLVRELAALYGAFSRGEASPLPPLAIQYADYAAWQRAWLTGDVLQRELSYWRGQLAGAPEALDLPTDRPRPPVQMFHGARATFELGPELTSALATLSRQSGATMFMTLLAGLDLLLARYSGQDDIVVGTPIANRTQAETEDLIGFFVNTLVLRARLSDEQSFRDLVAHVKEVALSAYAHQEVPFERLVEELRPRRDMSRSPLFQVAFALQNAPMGALELPGLRLSGLAADSVTTKFDLTLVMMEGPAGMSGSFEYSTDLFDAATIDRLIGHFRALLVAATQTPDAKLSALPLLDEAERAVILGEYSGIARAYPRGSTVHALFEEHARRAPDAVAVSFGDERLTYGELDRRANQLASHLRARGVKRESMVGLAVERSIEMVVATLGILKAGGVYVPFDPDYPEERLAFMLEDSGAQVIVTTTAQAARLPAGRASIVRLDADAATIAAQPVTAMDAAARATDLAYVMYTSGSTGRPKGVLVPHRAIVRLVRGTDYVTLGPDEVFLQFAPISFDASTLEIWGALLNGGRLAVAPPGKVSFAELGDTIRAHGVTSLWLTAGLFNAMIESAPASLKGARQLLVGGEALSVPHIAKALAELPGTRLINGYGPTEGTTFTCCHTITHARGGSIPIGRPVANTRVFILDRHRQPVPVGVPGELYIGGDGLARGYLNRPELTEARFVTSPFDASERLYRTGDLVRWLPDRTVEFIGRLDTQVKVRGYRIELGEIEAVLGEHDGVAEAVVLAREDTPGEKRLVGYVVAAAGATLDPASLKAFLTGKLPAFMVPGAFVMLDAMPLTPNGKVDRRALPAPQLGGSDAGYVAPSGAVEETLAAIWQELLGLARVGVDDDFFAIGGHSMLAARLVAEIQGRLGVAIPLAALFQSRTIRELAVLAAPDQAPRDENDWPALVTIQPKGTRPPFFAVSRPNINALGYVALARHLGEDQPCYGLQAQLREQEEIGPYTEEEYGGVADLYIKEMRKVQPHGPYYLGGMCEGAHIAYAIAQQLESEGEEIGLVAMLDAWPWENTHVKSLTVVHNMGMRFFRMEKMRRAGRSDLLLAGVAQAVMKRVKGLAGRIVRVNPLKKKTAGGGAQVKKSKQTIFEARMFPGPEFKAPKIKGRIGVFRVRNQPYWRVRNYQLGWVGRTTGGVEVHLIAGEHMTFLREPQVRVLALKLKAVLVRLAQKAAARSAMAQREIPEAAE